MSVRNRQKIREWLVQASTTHTATTTISTIYDLTGFQNLRLNAKVENSGGTNPTLDISVICFGVEDGDTFTVGAMDQIVGDGNANGLIDVRGVRFCKIKYTIGGTDTPTFDVELTAAAE